MLLLAGSEKKRVILAEIIIPPDGLQSDPPACVPFPYVFSDDDDETSGNGNVTVTLDANPNFEFNEDQTQLCLKVIEKTNEAKKSASSPPKPPPPGRYSLNILAQDNPKEAIHRLTKRFPLRVLIQSPVQKYSTPRLLQDPAMPLFKSSQVETDSTMRQLSKSPAADRILGAIQRPSAASPTPNRSIGGGGGGGNWEYRNVTIIAVLVCLACILCIILLAILLFMKKCTRVKNFVVKGEF